jgi:hypothetical protein
VKKLEEKEI